MGDTSLRQTIWSQRLLPNLQKELVYAKIATKTYEGEPKFGQSVKINSLSALTVNDYPGSGSVTWQAVNAASQSVEINNQKEVSVEIPHILQKQSNLSLVEDYTQEIAYSIADKADQSMVATYTDISSSMSLGTYTICSQSISSVSASAYDTIVDLAQKLSEHKVPRNNRFAVVPPWFTAKLAKDSRWNSHYEVLANGFVQGSKISGIQIYESNNVPTSGAASIVIAGHPDSWAFVGQLSEMNIITNHPDKFSDGVKTLFVYGCKVIRPEGLAYVTATPQ